MPIDAVRGGADVEPGEERVQGELLVPGSGGNDQVDFYAPPGFDTLAFSVSNGLVDPRAVEFGP